MVKLSDFGISKQLENTESLAVTQCGTTQYMSPERLIGEQYGFESDVWSMGVIILEALYGKLPFPTATNFMSSRTWDEWLALETLRGGDAAEAALRLRALASAASVRLGSV